MTAVALTLTLMLSACGDDGTGTKTSDTASSKNVAPPPSPSPSPARTYTYDKIDFKVDRSFIATAFYDDSKQGRGFLFGYPTNPAELGGADVRTYLALIDESENDKHGVESAPLTVDFSKSTISGTIPRVGENKAAKVYQLNGAIDAGKHLTGSLKSQDGKISGEFRGRLFGPGGKEIALIADFKLSDGTAEVGLLTGKLK